MSIKPITLTLKNYKEDVNSYLNFLRENDVNIDIVLNGRDSTLLKARIQDIGASESTKLYEKIENHAI